MLKRILVLVLIVLISIQNSASALTNNERAILDSGLLWYSPDGTTSCQNLAVTGKLLPDNITTALEPNLAIYQMVGEEKDIPWQLIAAIHFRETSGRRFNPPNRDGSYQILGSNYPNVGEITEEEFITHTRDAADVIIAKFSSVHPANRSQISSTVWSENMIKDVLFAYNGKSPRYKDQAVRLGFATEENKNQFGFEGSPYVMNLYDSIRDSSVNPEWYQFLSDGGNFAPANQQIGAWNIFEALTGSSSSCSTNPSASTVVEIAVREFELGVVEDPPGKNRGGRIDLYTDGNPELWCADFVSWVFREAGNPFDGGAGDGGWRIASTSSMEAWFKSNAEWYTREQLLSGAARAQPGDVYREDREDPNNPSAGHVGIVIEVSQDGKTLTTIDGNSGDRVKKNVINVESEDFFGVGRKL